MREILFKAKRLDNGEWVEGYFYKINDMNFIFPVLTNGSYDVSKHVIKFINPCYEVDENTLCQFTGLYDKNGNKIWENDVVSAVWYSHIEPIEDITGVVMFDQSWCAYVIYDELMKTKSELNGCGAGTYEFEVIGNIFDNPELLGGGE